MSEMKIKFDPNLTHQKDAINAVVGVFEGQEVFQSNFSVSTNALSNEQLGLFSQNNDIGVANAIKLLPEELYENTRNVQILHGLAQTENDKQKLPSLDFTIEMETGTGKTYVYLRSAFELNQRYGLTKFIIVVPSVAIKEGVYKSLQMTEEHFRKEYKNIQYDYFVYNSSKRDQVRNFATNDYIQIMVINIDAFSKSFTDPEKETKANLIHRTDDRLNGMKPIEFIQSTNPVVIIDEPQSVASTDNRKKAIASLNPLCTFRYSATLTENFNMLYKLDSIDAYERKLVKQIEVASIEVQDNHNQAYIKLLSVDNKKSPITAKLEIDGQTKTGKLKPRTVITVKENQTNDLFELSGGRTVYEGYVISDIYCEEGSEYIDFTSRDDIIELGQSIGEVDQDTYKRLQVSKTVEEHLEKELKFYRKITTGVDVMDHSKIISQKGIKVLSLFFIDKVANYRGYSSDGVPVQGKFACWFEEEFTQQLRKPKYRILYPSVWEKNDAGKQIINEYALKELASSVHNGYFAQDKKKDASGNPLFAESKMSKGEGGKTAADESAYNLIMKDKEKLLSMDEKLRFIFSHSALKEGWDNPNVFQICTLNETKSVMKKRQEIGRGLRLAVDQSGERVPYGFEVNTLTVMANESYEQFVADLQEEIEEEEGIKFGAVEKHQFANIVISGEHDTKEFLGAKKSEEIYQHLTSQGYIDKKGKIQDSLKNDLVDNTVSLPESVQDHSDAILATLTKVAKGLSIKKHEEKKTATLREDNGKQIVLGDDFKALWDRIKYKTTYRVNFSVGELVQKCIKEIRASVAVASAKFEYKKVKVAITEAELETYDEKSKIQYYRNRNFKLPDVVTYLESNTNLTRKTVVEILLGLGEKLEAFKNNPQRFIELASEVIRKQMRLAIVDGISYHRIGDDDYYAQEMFQEEELTGYLKDMVEANKSVYDYIICDSGTEFEFAEKLEESEDVKLYAKLPAWFKIDTPLGSYNPDWAVLIDKEDGMGDQLYFVVETKSSIFSDDLRASEQAKINCGIEHFKALSQDKNGNDLDNPAKFVKADNYNTFAKNLFE
ncbi:MULTISPECIES: type III restriction-modification system endonuclease [unclassified Colwellia]|uniref:type III restriction-modification system endonuclease n=1 Tax=unclassified Colwellia TaxID=196834 RepID=UPI0015F717BF|nr:MULTISPECIES: DEAD/DEAH box helicase family protein [unclassified Colwellia]MBA6233965.1 DEAD/DEAH box helicase family protein [Colwellia sp. MB02u-7]MBA6236971.1 DEAD/DEAH box helicase family protein [Colwellia sp. MB02u-11]MBA6300639.1 DEAD/DEAH box helicase family protein [Colwellia sp. MB3u-22]MBA6310602.1 DEAD/DEAH box helicase family protein [Colwellia sp. MB3u-64]